MNISTSPSMGYYESAGAAIGAATATYLAPLTGLAVASLYDYIGKKMDPNPSLAGEGIQASGNLYVLGSATIVAGLACIAAGAKIGSIIDKTFPSTQ